MYSSLQDAPVNTELVLVEVLRPPLAHWLQRMGLFVGGTVIRHDEEIVYHPVRVKGDRGDVVVPSGLGIKIFVHTENDEKKTLVEMLKNERGHIESMSCGRGCINALKHLGLEENSDVTFIRALPHMDYVTVIDRRERTRLSEGEAARIWGSSADSTATQFYFCRRGKPFEVQEIIGGRKIREHLKTHGVYPGCNLVLESIEQVQELHVPDTEHIIISSPGGLRLYLTLVQAGKIIVRAADRSEKRRSAAGRGLNE
ncbi:MAG: hypothetical protein CR981_04260 [Proteobacteria bacterium]|nr:MAG: hypothetical protein CR981_04260 [Pseudomonadota bacterium]PIE65367.1 MAG: hypothetical protein CSA26_03320 [Desulfobacterales bacterium]